MTPELENINRRIDAYYASNPNGWSPIEKSKYLAKTIYESKMKTVVEIGVFAGRSSIPMGFALDQLDDGGHIYAVDSWDVAACMEGDNSDENSDYWKRINYESIMLEFWHAISDHHLTDHVIPWRMTAEQASRVFGNKTVDLLHMDANHSEKSTMRDLRCWWPKLKDGAMCCFDDISWDSLENVVAHVKTISSVVHQEDNWMMVKKEREQ